MFYAIRNWGRFQHYKDRSPPWIKLHRDLLTSEDWIMMDDASRVLAIACMLVASDTDNRIPQNPAFLQRRAYLNQRPDFQPLLDMGFLQVIDSDGVVQNASRTLADASTLRRSARPETEAETETEAEAELSRAGGTELTTGTGVAA